MIYEVDGLVFAYTPQDRCVLNGVSFSVAAGEIVCILGRNGAGKSTLLNCMLRLLSPQAGSIRLCGKPVSAMHAKEIASLAGYVPQTHDSAFGYTVREYVLMGCAPRIGLFGHPGQAELARTEEALTLLGIEPLADRPCTEISGGERQQAAIARAIVAGPKAVLFDEPTAHLDFGNQLRVLRMLRDLAARGFAVVLTTHNPDHALLLGGKAALLDNEGRIACGPADELLTQQRLADVYGTDVRLEYVPGLDRTACVYPGL